LGGLSRGLSGLT